MLGHNVGLTSPRHVQANASSLAKESCCGARAILGDMAGTSIEQYDDWAAVTACLQFCNVFQGICMCSGICTPTVMHTLTLALCLAAKRCCFALLQCLSHVMSCW